MGIDATTTLIVALIWGIALFDVHLLRRAPHDRARQTTVAAAVLAALALTVLHPAVYVRIDRATGIPNAARAVGNSLGIVSAWAFLPVVARLAHKDTVRRGILGSVWVMLAAVGAMVWFYSRAPMPISDPYHFQDRYGGIPAVAAARAVLFAYLGVIVVRLFVLSLRNDAGVRQLSRRRERVQARLQTLGWGCAVGYALDQCLSVGLRASGIAPSLPSLPWLSLGLITGSCVALSSGIVFRGWAWLDRLRAYHKLGPLWTDLRSVYPITSVVQPHPAPGALGLLRRLDFHLYRRMVEIRDGLLLVRAPIEDPALEYAVDIGIGGEATAIARTIAALRLEGRTTPIAMATHAATRDDSRTDSELGQLVRLAVAYREARDQLDEETRSPRL